MGDSLPPAADFDLVGSYARRRGADVEITLADPSEALRAAPALVLRRGATRIDVPASVAEVANGTALVARAPAAGVGNGVWSIRIDDPDATGDAADGERRISARLLVQGDRPLVLLWGGRTPQTLVPPPRRTRGATASAQRPSTPKQSAAAAAGRALDKVLAPLSDQRATRVREAARSAARRVLN